MDDDDFMKRYNEVSSSQNSSIHALGIANIVNDSDEYDHNLSNQVDLAHHQTALKLSERAYQAFKKTCLGNQCL